MRISQLRAASVHKVLFTVIRTLVFPSNGEVLVSSKDSMSYSFVYVTSSSSPQMGATHSDSTTQRPSQHPQWKYPTIVRELTPRRNDANRSWHQFQRSTRDIPNKPPNSCSWYSRCKRTLLFVRQFRTFLDNHLKVKILRTFFGGSDASWATPVTTHTYFRNIRLWGSSNAANISTGMAASEGSPRSALSWSSSVTLTISVLAIIVGSALFWHVWQDLR